VTYGSTRFLLTGDLEAKEQDELIAEGVVEADVLKAPHHGSKTSDPAFFDAVGADIAVISVGADNPYGHPHQETLDALTGETVLRTDLDGRVTVRSDGRRVTWETER
jgi:competence protein ComEC